MLVGGIWFFVFKFRTNVLSEMRDAFAPAGRKCRWVCYPACRFALRRADCRLPLQGVGLLFLAFCSTCGLKVQKHLARGKAKASPRVNVPLQLPPWRGKSELFFSFCSTKLAIFIVFVSIWFSVCFSGWNNSLFWWNKSAFCSNKTAFYFAKTAFGFAAIWSAFLVVSDFIRKFAFQ